MSSFQTALASLGRRIRELRAARDWSQEELAHRAGISRTFMGTVEQGRKPPSLATLVRIAEAMRVPLAELFVPSAADKPSGREIVSRIQSRLLGTARTLAELRKIESLVEAFLRK